MLRQQITIPQWLQFPSEVRLKLIKIFEIPKSEGTYVVDKTVVSDGHNHDDLAHITVEKLQFFTESKEENFFTLMELALSKIYEETEKEQEEKILEAAQEKADLAESKAESLRELAKQMNEIASGAQVEVAKKKMGRPPKKV